MSFDPITAVKNTHFTIPSSKISADIADLPVTIDLATHCPEIFTDLGSNSLKFAVASIDGTQQYYVEIELWSTSSAVIHTRIPVVSSEEDTYFKLFWDNSQDDNSDYVGVAASTAAQNVWDDDFSAVYNLAQDPSGGSECIKDSTSNGYHGTPAGGMTSADLVSGNLGKAIQFDGSDDIINLPAVLNNSAHTLNMSFKYMSSSYCIPFARGAAGESVDTNKIEYRFINDYLECWFETGAGVNHLSSRLSNYIDYMNGAYHIVAVCVDDTDISLLDVDHPKVTGVLYVAFDSTAPCMIGSSYDGFSGIEVSNVWISKVVRSDAWNAAVNYSLDNNLLTSYSTSSVRPLIVAAGQLKQAPAGSIIESAILDENSRFVATTVDRAISEMGDTKFWNGFELQNPDTMGTLSWDETTRTVSLAVKSGQDTFNFWCNGKKIVKTETETLVTPNTTGIYYCYFDNDGVFSYVDHDSVTDPVFFEYAIVALVRWNATALEGSCGEERHGIIMDSATHKNKHKTTGALYSTGLNIEGLTNGSGTYTQSTSGKFFDEDIEHSVSALSTHPFLYRLGVNGEWTMITADNKVGTLVTGDTYYSWNEWDGSTWKLTEGTSSTDFFITFFVAVPDISGQMVLKIIGQNAYSSRLNARNAIEDEIGTLKIDGMPSEEFVFLAAVIVKRDGNLVALADGSTFVDLTVTAAGRAASSSETRYADDIPTDTAEFDALLSSADTSVQLALSTLNSHTHAGLSMAAVLTSTGGYDGLTLGLTVNDASAALGAPLYCEADFGYSQADASAEATMPCTAMALESGSGSKTVLLQGQICNTAWNWSAGDIYVSETTGALTQTAPTTSGSRVQKVGFALSADTMYFCPSREVEVVA